MRIFYKFLYIPTNVFAIGTAPDNYELARKVIFAIKNNTIWRPFSIPSGGKLVSVGANNIGVIHNAYGGWVSSYLKANGVDGGVLVPVPSKQDITGVAEGTAYKRFSPCMPKCTDFTLVDGLRFTELLPKASQGGPRFADQIYPKLAVSMDQPKGTRIILIDDIATSAGHIKASRAKLTDAGYTVEHAIVCGRTVHDVTGDPYKAGFFDVTENVGFAEDIDLFQF